MTIVKQTINPLTNFHRSSQMFIIYSSAVIFILVSRLWWKLFTLSPKFVLFDYWYVGRTNLIFFYSSENTSPSIKWSKGIEFVSDFVKISQFFCSLETTAKVCHLHLLGARLHLAQVSYCILCFVKLLFKVSCARMLHKLSNTAQMSNMA